MSGLDYCTIIGRDPKLFAWHVDNVLRNAGLTRDLWDFWTIVYYNEETPKEVTDEILDIAEQNDIKTHLHYEDMRKDFLTRLYDCWNLLYDIGDRELVLRGGSDQAWSKGSFQIMYDEYLLGKIRDDELVLQAQTVESPIAGNSRHFIGDFGDRPHNFKEEEFQAFCDEISRVGCWTIEEALDEWGHPTSFTSSLGANHNRVDGCSWLQSKSLFKKFGPMPTIRNGITGDVIIHDRYERNGIPSYLTGDAITYHLVRGERR